MGSIGLVQSWLWVFLGFRLGFQFIYKFNIPNGRLLLGVINVYPANIAFAIAALDISGHAPFAFAIDYQFANYNRGRFGVCVCVAHSCGSFLVGGCLVCLAKWSP